MAGGSLSALQRWALLLGIRRGEEPSGTAGAQAPLRPLTLPNLITFARLLGIPAFCALYLLEDPTRSTLALILFSLIAFSDIADGALARATGQYSRLGALVDPLADRLLVLAAVAVCLRWSLLPLAPLALLAARELAMIALGRLAQRRGIALKVNVLGRAALAGAGAAVFFALAGLRSVGTGFLYCALALAYGASAIYLRGGLRQLPGARRATGA
ncbi:MAG TPA: CDP-alcohol phosphatidyltransferase family protein [Solirubrobacteraceae bacterium]|nr:CDP-alcohol phosphatidyltransferase family protein [Solirubrobacteraceae bacterium]